MREFNQLIGNYVPKNINEIIQKSIKLEHPFQHFSTVMITDKENVIKGIGQSKPNNLILDQFGTWLAGFLRAPVSANKNISITDTANNARTMVIYYDQATSFTFNCFDVGLVTCGSRIQCGSGTTVATRSDYAIETALGTAPENALFDSGTGVYAVGSIACAGAVVAGGAGTVNETILTGHWRWGTGGDTEADFALFHDILGSGEAYVLGNTITVTYTINL